MNKFLEYLNTKGHLQNKPEVKVVADKVDLPSGRAKKPPVGQGMKNGMQPYLKSDGKVSRGTQKGFGDSGDRSLVYDVTKSPKPASIPTAESFYHHQLFPMVRETIKQNPALVEQLVRDLKRNGLLGILVGELSTHNETFQHLAQIMSNESHGPDVCKKFVRAMNEDVAPPMHASHNQMMQGDPTGMGIDPSGQLDPMGNPVDPNGLQGPSTGFDDEDNLDGMDDDPDGLDDFDDLDDDDLPGDEDGDEQMHDPSDGFGDDELDTLPDDELGQGLPPQNPDELNPPGQPGQPPRRMPAPPPQTMAPAMENLMRAYKKIVG